MQSGTKEGKINCGPDYFVKTRTLPFLECINVLTLFHYWINVNQEVVICAIDILYRYLAKCHSTVSDYNTAIRIIYACTLLAAKFFGSDEDELLIRDKSIERSKVDKKEHQLPATDSNLS